jgi:hypothetical protein
VRGAAGVPPTRHNPDGGGAGFSPRPARRSRFRSGLPVQPPELEVVPSRDMALTTAPERARWAGRLRLGVLTVVALLTAHTAIFAAQYGSGERFAQAMSASGHDIWWAPASLAVLCIGFVLLVQTVGGLAHLELRARRTPSGATRNWADLPSIWSTIVSIWRDLLPLVAVLFLVQENIEHLLSQGHLLGLEALGGPEYPLALPILAIVTLALSVLGALVHWRVAVLRARATPIADPNRRAIAADAAHGRWRTIGALAPWTWMSERLDAGRAPPEPLRP